jgi:hypothetical protein
MQGFKSQPSAQRFLISALLSATPSTPNFHSCRIPARLGYVAQAPISAIAPCWQMSRKRTCRLVRRSEPCARSGRCTHRQMLGAITERLNKEGESRGLLAAARIVEVIAGKGWTPVRQ